MKNIFKLFAGSLVLVAALAACGNRGGGGGTASPAGAVAFGGCVTDASGVCVGGYNSGYGFVGTGTWRGALTISNQQLLQQLYQESGRCRRGFFPYPNLQQNLALQCVQASFLRVSVMVQNGQVPGRGYFSIIPTLNGAQSGMALAKYADAYLNAGSNGFLLTYTPQFNQGLVGVPYQFPGQPGIQAPGVLQITTQWTDASRTLLNVNVIYKNGIIATGQLFNPQGGQVGVGTGVGGVYW